MRKPTTDECSHIEDMITKLRPGWCEAICKRADEPLPRRLPEVLGMTVKDAVLRGLVCDDPGLRRECAHDIWYGLSNDRVIHAYPGFNIICDLLGKDEG